MPTGKDAEVRPQYPAQHPYKGVKSNRRPGTATSCIGHMRTARNIDEDRTRRGSVSRSQWRQVAASKTVRMEGGGKKQKSTFQQRPATVSDHLFVYDVTVDRSLCLFLYHRSSRKADL